MLFTFHPSTFPCKNIFPVLQRFKYFISKCKKKTTKTDQTSLGKRQKVQDINLRFLQLLNSKEKFKMKKKISQSNPII